MIAPICVAAAVRVGDWDGSPSGAVSNALASPKSKTLTVPSSLTFDIGGFQISVNDTLLMCSLYASAI